ncbi:Frataxin,Frataxin/CyaY,Frataxin conserved site [Cinara cedri]|uniref:ferroxidase n=1 Tax=Cinara cedri TaxID=506608 RepID=A0A5E4MB13_9HEMI|nr:Frataxin,Frataxin/CyaY,Frataxin conserved site [Cinara cedri]
MFLKIILRSLVSKNEFFTKIFSKQKYCSISYNKLLFSNQSLQRETKFKHQDIRQSYLLKHFSALNNQNEIEFMHACNETLESLCEYFEEIVENSPQLDNPDITFSDGVLTLQLGPPYGTYVINRQTPNKQIWLSSPKSGPKRYDFDGTKWIYKHDDVSLHELLTIELSTIFSIEVNFSKCVFSGYIQT